MGHLRGECERDDNAAGAGDCDRAKSTTLWPTLLTALVECELFEFAKPIELLRPKFVLPITNVTLSVIDFNVATASSCVTFSKLRSPCFVQRKKIKLIQYDDIKLP